MIPSSHKIQYSPHVSQKIGKLELPLFLNQGGNAIFFDYLTRIRQCQTTWCTWSPEQIDKNNNIIYILMKCTCKILDMLRENFLCNITYYKKSFWIYMHHYKKFVRNGIFISNSYKFFLSFKKCRIRYMHFLAFYIISNHFCEPSEMLNG